MSDRLSQTLEKIDAINSQDPNLELVDGKEIPKELIYSKRMSRFLEMHYPGSSELLQIATRAQHIKRWAIPRSDYPMDRKGYLKWRTQLKIMHGNLTGEIMQSTGYGDEDIKYVKDLLMKKDLKKNDESQTLEDLACLVFLDNYIVDFAAGKDEDKLIDILQKTWGKMSEKGQSIALTLNLPAGVSQLISKALNQ